MRRGKAGLSIAWVANNYGSVHDTIGGYTKCLCDAARADKRINRLEVFSGNTYKYGLARKILSPIMTAALIRAKRYVNNDRVDYVITEYPFIEWNPLIIFGYWGLARTCKKRGTLLVLSLHEFVRASRLRRFVARQLCENSDAVFITNDENENAVRKFSNRVFRRETPSPLQVNWHEGEKKPLEMTFIYFGLINSSKAFNEMIQAFKEFSENRKLKLLVYSSSFLDAATLPSCVEFHYCESDEALSEALKRATYCILPIRPEISRCSGSIKSAAQAGCTVIGRKGVDLVSQDFIVGIDSNDKEGILNGLKSAEKLTHGELKRNAESGIAFGNRFSFDKTFCEIVSSLEQC